MLRHESNIVVDGRADRVERGAGFIVSASRVLKFQSSRVQASRVEKVFNVQNVLSGAALG